MRVELIPASPSSLRNRVSLPAKAPHDPLEVPDVARRPVPEPEVLPNHHSLRPDLTDEHVPDELLRTLPGEFIVEPDRPHLVGPVPEQGLSP
jgi:hypothetical protein